jgi:type IV pilus assembly protein PilM
VAKIKNVLGLDIGTHSVCAVEASGNANRVEITGLGWEHVPSPDLLEDTILAVIRENNLKPKNIVTSVSGRLVIVRYVNMPKMPQEELEQAIRYEADKYIPYNVDEVYITCQQLEEAQDAKHNRVLLVAARKQLVDEHVQMLKRIGLAPAVVDVDFFALGNAFELCNANGEMASSGEAVALVDIGSAKTSVCIVRNNSGYFTREIFTAGTSMTDAVATRFGEDPADVELMKEDPGEATNSILSAMLPVLEEIGNEVRLSFDYYENQFDCQVSKVFLSGGAIKFPGIPKVLGEIFEISTEVLSPFGHINMSTSNDIIENTKAESMTIALGLASRVRGM